MINGDMSLAVLGTDARTRSAADTAAGIINDHDHATELTIKVVLAITDTEHFACLVDAVGMHDLARADLEAATAADAHRRVDRI